MIAELGTTGFVLTAPTPPVFRAPDVAMACLVGFHRFVALDERDAPRLVARMSKEDLPVDGERYGIVSRLIARPGVEVPDLAVAVIEKLCHRCEIAPGDLGAVVLSSRIYEVQEVAEALVARLAVAAEAHGLERACSGFPAATELAANVCARLRRPVVLVAAEIISRSINWEPAAGDLGDHRRARGQAAKLFGDGAAAVMLQPYNAPGSNRGGQPGSHAVLDAWAGEVPDEDQLIQKIEVRDSRDPWGHVRPGPTDCMSMPGRRGVWLVRRAPQIMADALRRSVARAKTAGRMADDEHVAHVVPHQPNALILRGLEKELSREGCPVRVWSCIAHAGNTVSASIPLAMAQVQDEVPAGAVLAMPSVGAGGPGYRPHVLSTGCVLIRMGEQADDASRN